MVIAPSARIKSIDIKLFASQLTQAIILGQVVYYLFDGKVVTCM